MEEPQIGGVLHVASLANLASVFMNSEIRRWNARGDPTEIALQVLAMKFGRERKSLQE